MRVVIYGAQGIALGLFNAIKVLFPSWCVEAFLVTSLDANPVSLAGIPVMELDSYATILSEADRTKIQVLIATPETVMDEIEKTLVRAGLFNYERVDSLKWAKYQEDAFFVNKRFITLSSYDFSEKCPEIEIYMAKFWKDKKLCTNYNLPSFTVSVQAGAENTDVRVASLIDCDGDNISRRNSNYSELTVLYWAWKNKFKEDKYYGLEHYRRVLDIDEENSSRLVTGNIDVILPYPMPYEPNIEMHHNRYLSDEEWDAVLQALIELYPDRVDEYKQVLEQQYMYNYNIIVAKRSVLSAYCEWLFSILERVEELVDPMGDRKPNRYIGYIGETLETLYFMDNKDDLKIAHTGCRLLV